MTDKTVVATRLGSTSNHFFISYSRHDITLVDSLVREMDKRGLPVWVDFRSLVPGTPYQTQLETAIEVAQSILLVVTPESIASPEVALELHHALVKGKRVILLIWVACPLDESTHTLEWVDLRQRWTRAMDDLQRALANPARQPTSPPPQHNTRRPPAVRLFHLMSLYVAVWSLFGLALPFFPWYLMRLPRMILRRTYKFSSASWMLALIGPLAFIFGAWMLGASPPSMRLLDAALDFPLVPHLMVLALYIFILGGTLAAWGLGWLMVALLWLSPGMYRWGGPGGARIRTRKWRPPVMPTFQPVSVALEHAPQDGPLARRLESELSKAGHTLTDDSQAASVTLVLLSRFKTDTELDPEVVRIFPTLVQTPPGGRVADKLARVQWLDLRPGPRLYPLLARLLHEPPVLLEALGTLPVRNVQTVRPRAVTALINLFWLVVGLKFALSFVEATVYLSSIQQGTVSLPSRPVEAVLPLTLFVVFSAIGLGLTIAATRSLANRGGIFQALIGPLAAFGAVAITAFPGLATYMWVVFVIDGDPLSMLVSLVTVCSGGVFAIPVVLMMALNRDLRLWMPLTGRLPRP